MTTITKTTAAAVSRKLSSLGFEKYDGTVGFEVYADSDSEKSILASHRIFDHGQTDTIVDALYKAGYEVEIYNYKSVFSWNAPGVVATTFKVLGRVGA